MEADTIVFNTELEAVVFSKSYYNQNPESITDRLFLVAQNDSGKWCCVIDDIEMLNETDKGKVTKNIILIN